VTIELKKKKALSILEGMEKAGLIVLTRNQGAKSGKLPLSLPDRSPGSNPAKGIESSAKARKFVDRWAGFLTHLHIEDSKYKYLMDKHK